MIKRLGAALAALLLSATLAAAQFVDQRTWGGTSSGTNIISITIPNWSANLAGVPLRFIPLNTNTAAATLNVSGLGAVTLQKRTSSGLVALAAGDLVAGVQTTATYDGTVFQIDAAPRATQVPTFTNLTSGSGATYTTPAGAAWLNIQCVGAGGGALSGTGGTTTFNSVTAIGGSPGLVHSTTTGGLGGAGGTGGTGGTGTTIFRLPGGAGQDAGFATGSSWSAGGAGGSSPFVGAGTPSNHAAAANSGGGSGGVSAGGGSGGTAGDGGGGAGEYFKLFIGPPSATYTYTIGAGTNGGGSGRCLVEEHYN